MREPVRILSDLHLGHRVSRIGKVEALRPLVAGAGTVIFNGDTWQELSKELRVRSREMLGELVEICREEGCEVVFLPGNHDPGWPGRGYLELAGGRIVVTHGDMLLRSGSPWKREILGNEAKIDEVWARHPAAAEDVDKRHAVAREIALLLRTLKHARGRKLWQRAFDAMMPPQRGMAMLKAWWNQGKNGDAFCDRYFPEAEFLVIGHFHWSGIWKAGRRRVINTGSFVSPSRAYWVELEGGEMRFGKIMEVPDSVRAGVVLERWNV